MRKVCKSVSAFLIFVMMCTYTSFAANEVENNPSAEANAETAVDIEAQNEVDKIVGKLETVLDPENHELEQDLNNVIEKHSDNWLVKLFKTIIDAISGFLDAIFELATEATKIEVD